MTHYAFHPDEYLHENKPLRPVHKLKDIGDDVLSRVQSQDVRALVVFKDVVDVETFRLQFINERRFVVEYRREDKIFSGLHDLEDILRKVVHNMRFRWRLYHCSIELYLVQETVVV